MSTYPTVALTACKGGVQLGPQTKFTDFQQAEARKRLDAGESSIAKTMAVHHATVARLAS
jgi:hypothetical protein